MNRAFVCMAIIVCAGFSVLLPEFAGAQQDSSSTIYTPNPNADTVKAAGDVVELLIRWFKIDTSHKYRVDRKVRFSLLPSGAAVPGGGAAVVTTLNAAFYLGDRSTTNLSTADFTPVLTTTGKIMLSLKSTLWFRNNFASIITEARYFKYPDYTWGIGGNTPEENRSIMEFEYFRYYQALLKKIAGNTSFGLGYRFDKYYNIAEELEDSAKPSNIAEYPYGTGNKSQSSGLTLQLLYDSRKNSINPPDGQYLSVVYRDNLQELASDHEWQSIYADGRAYVPLNSSKRKLLAFRSYYWGVLSGKVPYLDLPSNGWDFTASSRGIRRGRHRSSALLYAESEYRFDISQNGFWGAVAFVNCLGASDFYTKKDYHFHPAAGLGVRMKFNKYSRSNVALDFAFSKGFYGFYLNLGEAF